MRKNYFFYVILPVLFYAQQLSAQVDIWIENFTYANGTTTGQGSPAIASWTAAGTSGGNGVDVQSNVLRGRNTQGPNPDRTTWMIDAGDPIEIGNYTNVSITIDLSEAGNLQSSDYIRVQYSVDGGSWTNFATNGYITNDFTSAVASQTGLSGTTLRLQIIMFNNNTSEIYYADNIVVQGTPNGPNNPGSFSATALSSSEIDLDFTTNGSVDNVVIVYNNSGTFSTPSGTPPAIGQSFAGGTLIANGTTSPVNHNGLSASTHYYYKAWSFDGTNYSIGLTDDAITLCGAVTLPWSEGFEDVGPTTTFTANQTSINGTCNWSYEKDNNGRLQFGAYAHNGSQAAAMDCSPTGTYSINYLIATLDLSAYSTATDLTLSFWHMNQGEEQQTNDAVFIRGSNSDTWITIYDLFTNQGSSGTWVEVSGLDIDNALSSNGQVPTSTFQLRFGQEDNFSFTNDGRAFDDILIEGSIVEAELIWSGDVDTDWNNMNNWLSLEVPGSGNNVTIPDGLTNYPVYDGDFDLGTICNNLTMVGNSQLTVNGDLIIPGGYSFICDANAQITVEGNWTNNGNFSSGSSTVTFNGSTNSVISGVPAKSSNKSVNTFNYQSPQFNAGAAIQADVVQNTKPVQVPQTDAQFDLQFQWPVGSGFSEAGIETDGNYIYTTRWDGTGEFNRYQMDGTFVETFTIATAAAVRDLAFDGTYFYGAPASTTLFEMDFTQGSETHISTITAPVDVRAIAYSEVDDAFYGNNWSADITKFDRLGNNLGSFAVGPTGTAYYGLAFDNYSNGAPYLWGYAQLAGSGLPADDNWLIQMALPSGTETGTYFNVASVLTLTSGIAGGLCIHNHFAPGSWTIMGMAQNDQIWGLALTESTGFYNLVDSKSNAEVIISDYVSVANNLTVNAGAYLTTNSGSYLEVTGNTTIQSDATGMASFVDNGSSTFSIAPKVKLYLTPDVWHFVSVPTNNALSGIFENAYLRGYDEPTDSWGDWIVPLDSSLSIMTGYAAWVPGSAKNAVFQGELNNGSYAANVTAQSTTSNIGYNFIGNPFPSYLDWDAASGWSKGTADNTIYYYSGAGGLSNYKYYQGAGGELPGIGHLHPGNIYN
ncbi:MAG TPA: hypothetical protein PK904_06760, partial [Bacteroidales bacterium]|nr:hypothetical protein [Bacteroidales bacterium]